MKKVVANLPRRQIAIKAMASQQVSGQLCVFCHSEIGSLFQQLGKGSLARRAHIGCYRKKI